MNKFYSVLFISLMACSLSAQTFTEITGTPFQDIKGPVAFADFDNDNDQDVMIGSKLFLNGGEGNFEEGMLLPINVVEIYAIAVADVDNDDDQDVVISWKSPDIDKEEEHTIHTKLFNNDGNGAFVQNLTFVTAGSKCGSLAFADVNNDNNQDILITGFIYGIDGISLFPETALYMNEGNGLFTESTYDNFADLGYGGSTFADVDNDEDLDVLVSGFNGTYAVSILYINDGSGVYTESTGNSFAGVGDCSNAFGDIDNDNDLDLLITGWSGIVGLSYTELYTNNGDGQFTQVTNTPFVVVGASSAAFADIDNDNDLDVLISGYNGIETHADLYVNDGNGGFELDNDAPFLGAARSSLAFADIDNDGDQDVLISGFADWFNEGPENPQTHLYLNNTITTGLPEVNPMFGSILIFPNPNQGQVSIDLGELKDFSLKVYSLEGQLIYHKESVSGPIHQFELKAKAGIYILKVSTQQEKQEYKLIKE